MECKSVFGAYVTLDADGCRHLSKLLCRGLLCICRCSKSSNWTFKQFLLEWSFSCSHWFPGWELSPTRLCSPPLNGFLLLGFWMYLNFPIICFPAFPLISFPLVLVLTHFCGPVWSFSIPVCRLSSSNRLPVPQSGPFDTSAASLTFAFHVLSAWKRREVCEHSRQTRPASCSAQAFASCCWSYICPHFWRTKKEFAKLLYGDGTHRGLVSTSRETSASY